MKTLTPDAITALGGEQYAIGKSGAVEKITHGIQADQARSPDRVAAAIDIENAFGSISRSVVAEEVSATFPAVSSIVGILYGKETPLLWEDSRGEVHIISATTGVDQGCPFSLLAFLLGLKKVLARTHTILQAEGVDEGVTFRAYVDDVYAVCSVTQLPRVLAAFRQAAAEVGLRLNETKLKIWGQPVHNLPAELQQFHTPALQLLGHATERSAGELQTTILGDACGSFEGVLKKLRSALARLWTLHVDGGLSMQSTQALGRLAANSMPQHVLRGTTVTDAQRATYDEIVNRFWSKLLGEPAGLDVARATQLHLPLREGGFSAGGVTHRADAAFLAGTLGALDEIKWSAGVATVAQLRSVCPNLCNAMDTTTTTLMNAGAYGDLTLWQSDQPQPSKGGQRKWTRGLQAMSRNDFWNQQRYATSPLSAPAQPQRLLVFLTPPTSLRQKWRTGLFKLQLVDVSICSRCLQRVASQRTVRIPGLMARSATRCLTLTASTRRPVKLVVASFVAMTRVVTNWLSN